MTVLLKQYVLIPKQLWLLTRDESKQLTNKDKGALVGVDEPIVEACVEKAQGSECFGDRFDILGVAKELVNEENDERARSETYGSGGRGGVRSRYRISIHCNNYT